MVNTLYEDIAKQILAMVQADAEFSDISFYYLHTRILESVAFPACFVAKTDRDTKERELELNSSQVEDVLTYQVEVYYLDDYGHEDELNRKDYALKELIAADSSLGGLVSDSKCAQSKIYSRIIKTDLVSVLAAKIIVYMDY